jgi:hypothetical protein
MNLTELQDEITGGPLAHYCADAVTAGNDGAIADVLNDPTYETATGSISRALFAIWVAETGMRAAIRDHANNTQSPLRSIAISLEDFLGGAAETLDLALPANQAMLGAWVSAGGCTQEQADDLLSRAQTPMSRAMQAFGEPVTIQQIAQALRG